MQIYLTFDYELYFGERTGTVEKCITGPTAMLTEMADRQGIKLCQFVDIGFLIKLEEAITKYPHLQQDYTLISRQLEQLNKTGHDLQLHIHPHWEDSYYDGNRWHCRVDRYKLSDFNDQEIADELEEDYSLKYLDKYHKKTRENQKVVDQVVGHDGKI